MPYGMLTSNFFEHRFSCSFWMLDLDAWPSSTNTLTHLIAGDARLFISKDFSPLDSLIRGSPFIKSSLIFLPPLLLESPLLFPISQSPNNIATLLVFLRLISLKGLH